VFDVIAVTSGRGTLPGATHHTPQRFLLVDYYGQSSNADSLDAEHRELLEMAAPLAAHNQDSTIVIQSTLPIGPRFTNLVRGYIRAYGRNEEGDWVPRRM
jgi:hypothetical protein